MLLGQLNNKMLYMVLHACLKGANIAYEIHNPGLLEIWEIKCTKYLFRYT